MQLTGSAEVQDAPYIVFFLKKSRRYLLFNEFNRQLWWRIEMKAKAEFVGGEAVTDGLIFGEGFREETDRSGGCYFKQNTLYFIIKFTFFQVSCSGEAAEQL